ncbi:MAG: hypothetical protein QM811_22410 [Pirellulales bacterium]
MDRASGDDLDTKSVEVVAQDGRRFAGEWTFYDESPANAEHVRLTLRYAVVRTSSMLRIISRR